MSEEMPYPVYSGYDNADDGYDECPFGTYN